MRRAQILGTQAARIQHVAYLAHTIRHAIVGHVAIVVGILIIDIIFLIVVLLNQTAHVEELAFGSDESARAFTFLNNNKNCSL